VRATLGLPHTPKASFVARLRRSPKVNLRTLLGATARIIPNAEFKNDMQKPQKPQAKAA